MLIPTFLMAPSFCPLVRASWDPLLLPCSPLPLHGLERGPTALTMLSCLLIFSFLFLLIDLQLAPLRTQAPWEQDFHHLAGCCVPIPSTGPGSWREGQGQTHRGTQLGDTSFAKQNESGESLGAQPKEPSGGYDVSMWWLQLGEPGFGDCLRATSSRTYFKHETCFKRRRQCLQENTSDLGVL